MSTATLDSPLKVGEFALRPDDTVATSYEHLHRRRSIRLRPSIHVVFEDEQTLWFRIQELVRYAQHAPQHDIQKQFNWYQRLIPGHGRLIAVITVSPRDPFARQLRAELLGGRLLLRSDAGHEVPGEFLEQRCSDRLIGSVSWAEFRFDTDEREALNEPFIGWELALEFPGGQARAIRLTERMVESLSADVE